VRTVWRVAWPLAVLAGSFGLVFFVASCGGGDGSQDQPTASATASVPTLTPDERSEAEALLKAAALRAEDLPEGLLLEDEGFATNEELGEVGDLLVEMFYSAGGVSLKDRFYSSGRILGYHANYKADAPSDPSSLSRMSFNVSVDLYRDSAGLHAGFELLRQHLPDETAVREIAQEFYESLGMELGDLSVSSPSFAEVGDERVAREMKVTVRTPDLDTDIHFVLRWVCIQRDRLFGSLMMMTVNASPPVEQLEDLARKLDERMKDALE
jgi:hypothetical protein